MQCSMTVLHNMPLQICGSAYGQPTCILVPSGVGFPKQPRPWNRVKGSSGIGGVGTRGCAVLHNGVGGLIGSGPADSGLPGKASWLVRLLPFAAAAGWLQNRLSSSPESSRRTMQDDTHPVMLVRPMRSPVGELGLAIEIAGVLAKIVNELFDQLMMFVTKMNLNGTRVFRIVNLRGKGLVTWQAYHGVTSGSCIRGRWLT